MTVLSEIQVYEVSGVPSQARYPTLRIHSHWNDTNRAVIETPDGHKYTIIRGDMEKALTSAGNRR